MDLTILNILVCVEYEYDAIRALHTAVAEVLDDFFPFFFLFYSARRLIWENIVHSLYVRVYLYNPNGPCPQILISSTLKARFDNLSKRAFLFLVLSLSPFRIHMI